MNGSPEQKNALLQLLMSHAEKNWRATAEWLLDFIAAQPKVVTFGAIEIDNDPLQSSKHHDVPAGYVVDPERQSLAGAATTLAADEGISFTEAVRRLGG